MTKNYRVKETYQVEVWSYVEAKSKKEAEDLIEMGEAVPDFDYLEEEYIDTDWTTLEELTYD